MKTLKLMMCAAVMALLLTACGKTSYDPAACKALSEKIEKNEQISEDDCNQMIDQLLAISKIMKEKEPELKDNREKMMEFMQNEENQDMVKYAMGFTFYLEMHKKDLSAKNLKQLEEIQNSLQEEK